jgi:hypothetical protein
MNVPITPSMLVTAGRCMMQIPYFHLMGLKMMPGLARETGKGLDTQLLDVDRKSFIETGQYKDINELKEGFHNGIESVISDIPDSDDVIEQYGGTTKAFNETIRNGFELLDKYNEDRSVTEASKVQESFEIPIADTTLRGRFDMDVNNTTTADLKYRNLAKKGARRPNPDDLSASAQFKAYAYAKSVMTKEPEQCVDVVHAWATREGPVVFRQQLPVFTEVSHNDIEEKAYRLHKIIQADAFYPVDKSSQNGWVCQEKYCGAWKAYNRTDDFKGCPFGERSRVSV